jgi:UDP-N-acetyl-D-glucosamine dehydrogenase
VNVGVVGLGYVGSALATSAISVGHSVVGVDFDVARVLELKNLLKIDATTDYSTLFDCEIVVIAVPTPLDAERKPDLSFILGAIGNLEGVLKPGVLVINESTSYPGTLRNLIAAKLGENFLYAVAPERVDPASTDWNIGNTPRLISGLNEAATKKALEFYSTICDEVVVVSSPEVAEAAKLMENTFRQVNIALVNEFAQVMNSLGVSAHEVLDAAATKPFGFMKFLPSVGVGGHCIPIDPSYLSFVALLNGKSTKFIDIANQINLSMPIYVAERIADSLGGVSGKRIQIAGVAYKSNVSDTRETPARTLIEELRRLGADVSWHDPLVSNWNGEVSSPLEIVDAGVIVAPHKEIDFSKWKNNQLRIFDVSIDQGLGWKKFI